ncbi:MFS general substrate transporter [Colletotrichum somersetense]|nr:MFS general substrate transporter [Colletotrichum somersetense]
MKELGMTSDQYDWVGSINGECGTSRILGDIWYRTDEIGKPLTGFFAWSNLAGIVGSLLCYGISYLNGVRDLSAWRWVYLLEGLATVVFSGVVFCLLPDYPKSLRSSRFLTEREQEIVEARLPENAPLTSDSDFAGGEIWAVLRRPLIWSFVLSQTLINIGGYALTWYLPTIVTNLSFAGLPRNQLLSMSPAFAAIVGLIFSAWFMSRAYIVRPAYIMILMSGMVVCFVLFFTSTDHYGSYFIPFWASRSATLSGSTGTAFTLGLQSGIAQLCRVIGPQLFQSRFAYNGYKTSFAIAAATTIASFLANLWKWWLTRNTEYDVMRVRRKILKARKVGKVNFDDDIRVFEERRFYDGFKRQGGNDGESS